MNNRTLRNRSIIMWAVVALPILWLLAIITSPGLGIIQLASFALLLVAGAAAFLVLSEMLWLRGIGASEGVFWQRLYRALKKAVIGYGLVVLAALIYAMFSNIVMGGVTLVLASFGVWWILSGVTQALELVYEERFKKTPREEVASQRQFSGGQVDEEDAEGRGAQT